MTFQRDKKLRIYDCRGFDLNEENQQHYENDIINTIDGHIKKDYEVEMLNSFVLYIDRHIL